MNETIAPIYLDGTYAAQNAGFGDDNAAWKAGYVVEMLRRRGIVPKTICEVGCGGGGILLELSKLLPTDVTFTGYEPMPEAFQVCSQRATDRISFINESPTGVVPLEKFDVVLCLDVFEHVEDYLGFLRSLRGLGKTFIFHIPLDMNVQTVLRLTPLKKVRSIVGHLHYFCKETALATLKDSGFQIDESFYTDSSKSSYSTLPAKLIKFPRKLLYLFAPDFAVRLLGGYPLMVAATPK